jgi:hypothetical protein
MRSRARKPRPLVVVVSTPEDPHARRVLAALRRCRVRTALVRTSNFPRRIDLGLWLSPEGEEGRWRGSLRGRRTARLDDDTARAVWWRRTYPYSLPASVDRRTWGALYCTCDAALGTFWDCLGAFWVNEPAAEEAAERKPAQLALAARLGLTVPATCITNDPDIARAFIRERPDGETIQKNLVSLPAMARPTRVARADDPGLPAALRRAPCVFQERIEAAADLRVTIAGDDLFATEIVFPGGRHALDWRYALRWARFRRARLPGDVDGKLRRLVRSLGLVYGAIDLRRRKDGRHVFLEVNPSGEFLFVEERTGQPITAALASLLARGRAGRAAAGAGRQVKAR